MGTDDEKTLESIVSKHLFPWRMAGAMLFVSNLAFGLLVLGDLLVGIENGRGASGGAVCLVASCLPVSALGVVLWRIGRRVRESKMFALLTRDAAAITSLRFIAFAHRNYSYVFVGMADGREHQLSHRGSPQQAVAFFTRLYPHARVVSR